MSLQSQAWMRASAAEMVPRSPRRARPTPDLGMAPTAAWPAAVVGVVPVLRRVYAPPDFGMVPVSPKVTGSAATLGAALVLPNAARPAAEMVSVLPSVAWPMLDLRSANDTATITWARSPACVGKSGELKARSIASEN